LGFRSFVLKYLLFLLALVPTLVQADPTTRRISGGVVGCAPDSQERWCNPQEHPNSIQGGVSAPSSEPTQSSTPSSSGRSSVHDLGPTELIHTPHVSTELNRVRAQLNARHAAMMSNPHAGIAYARYQQMMRDWRPIAEVQAQFIDYVEETRLRWDTVDNWSRMTIPNGGRFRSLKAELMSLEHDIHHFKQLRKRADGLGAHNFQSSGGGGSVREELDFNIGIYEDRFEEIYTRSKPLLAAFYREHLEQYDTPPAPTPRPTPTPAPVVRPPSPPLEAVYPEFSVVPIFQRLGLPVARRVLQIVNRFEQYRDEHDYPMIEARGEQIRQDMSPEALAE
jgi:hypothetical protein